MEYVIKREIPMWGRVSGSELCPELWTIMNESHGRRTQGGFGEDQDPGLCMPCWGF